jgi:hypothetical protein
MVRRNIILSSQEFWPIHLEGAVAGDQQQQIQEKCCEWRRARVLLPEWARDFLRGIDWKSHGNLLEHGPDTQRTAGKSSFCGARWFWMRHLRLWTFVRSKE